MLQFYPKKYNTNYQLTIKNQTPALSDYNERQFYQIIGTIWKGLTHDEKEIYKRLEDVGGTGSKNVDYELTVRKHVVYREVLKQSLTEEIQDSVFFTQVSVMWKEATEEDRKKYKDLATTIKSLQDDKDKIYSKKQTSCTIFFNMCDDNPRDPEHNIRKIKTKKGRKQENPKMNHKISQIKFIDN
ncbi:hypothetical protein GLOIN_2v1701663 [Rhizophagus clarus]|uniref:Uncharacterized protein n=1 Tax=Rhizophagus clarus TaxID=94130 RepID=A0A8H3KZ76_9GLOM|nr:hypothetical protein GLOIN_2v1701663 [Rhizophagus clarus]